jgi:molecular chaperone DnaJ
MEKRKDLYLILGVPRDASTAAIKRAYRRLAKKLHPDAGAHDGAEAFQDLQTAYETLADAESRQRYDQGLTQNERNRYDTLALSFLHAPGAGLLKRPTQPGSLSGEILLSAREAAAGGVLPLDVPLTTTCPSCDGTGGYVFDCDRCYGDGQIQRRLPVPLRIPEGVKDGTVFQVVLDDPSVVSVLLTIHIRRN